MLARQLDIQCHNIRDTCPLYTVGGAPVDPEVDARIQDMYNSLLDELNDYREEMDAAAADTLSLGRALEVIREDRGLAHTPLESHLFNWHLAWGY